MVVDRVLPLLAWDIFKLRWRDVKSPHQADCAAKWFRLEDQRLEEFAGGVSGFQCVIALGHPCLSGGDIHLGRQAGSADIGKTVTSFRFALAFKTLATAIARASRGPALSAGWRASTGVGRR